MLSIVQTAKNSTAPPLLSLIVVAASLTGCDMAQTRAGDVSDVGFQESTFRRPEFDRRGASDWQELDVSLARTTIKVPKLKQIVEEQTVTIPKIEVEWPGREGELVESQICVEVETESPGYHLQIERVYMAHELIVISRLTPTSNLAGSTRPERLSDYVVITAPRIDVNHFVIGSRPARKFNDGVEFIGDLNELSQRLEGARLLYRRG